MLAALLRQKLGQRELRGLQLISVSAWRDRLGALWWYDQGVIAAPSALAKRRHLLGLLTERGHTVFVESGTFLGHTAGFLAPHTERVVTVEIDAILHRQAARRLAGFSNVEVMLGDASEIVPRVVASIEAPSLIWLDGHYSGGVTGQGEEPEPAVHILHTLSTQVLPQGTTIVVDDVRNFGRQPDVPSLTSLIDAARALSPTASLAVELDSLVVDV